jgi:hypothetical protein
LRSIAARMNQLAFPVAFLEYFRLYFRQGFWEDRVKKIMGNFSVSLFLLPTIKPLGCPIPIENLFLETADEDGVVGEFEKFGLFAVHRLAQAEIELEFASVLYFLLKRGVCKDPLLRAGKVEGLGHELYQKDRGSDRSCGRDGFDDAGEPVIRMPEVPNFHDMRSATSNDEYSEADEDPAEGEIAPFANEPDERDWNRKIRQRNQQVRSRVQPYQSGVPEIAKAVWLEVTRAEKLPQEIQGSPATTPVTKAP